MKLSIITINYNNAKGLESTLNSVLNQSYEGIEHIIVDGASTDNSVDVIKEYVRKVESGKWRVKSVIWSSEPDRGIYDGMNRGIRKATGDYIQILNSGDLLATLDVTERMMAVLNSLNAKRSTLNENGIPILYGNMVHVDAQGKPISKSREVEYSLRQYFSSTMNHDCCYIRRDLFETYGLYDENLRIVSDWKWFLQAIGLGHVKPVYVDIDVTHFDMGGVSETNLKLRNQERRKVLEDLMPPAVLADYDAHAFDAEQMNRIRKHHLYWFVYFIERVLFKLEKWNVIR